MRKRSKAGIMPQEQQRLFDEFADSRLHLQIGCRV